MKREEDLKIWEKAENDFAALLVSRGRVAKLEITQWNFPDYDIKIQTNNWQETTFEVKVDQISNTSGKVWIEFEYSGHPSWIFASKADYAVYKLWTDFYIANRASLLSLLTQTNIKELCQWGDNWTAKLRVIPKEEFYKVAHKF